MNKLPPVYMVYLPSYEKRWRYTLEHLVENSINPILFKGIDAIQWKLYTKHEENNDLKKFTSGRIGCFLSHYMLWNHLYHSNIEEAIVLEDDVRLVKDFNCLFFNYKNQLPIDWQFVFLGCEWINVYNKEVISDNIIKGYPYCTYAYMIKKTSLDVLLNECSSLITYLDIQLQKKVLPKLKTYVFNPKLVMQESINCYDGVYKSLCKDWEFDL